LLKSKEVRNSKESRTDLPQAVEVREVVVEVVVATDAEVTVVIVAVSAVAVEVAVVVVAVQKVAPKVVRDVIVVVVRDQIPQLLLQRLLKVRLRFLELRLLPNTRKDAVVAVVVLDLRASHANLTILSIVTMALAVASAETRRVAMARATGVSPKVK
jgi:hypothetical protein